jgi:hypothetical protein
MHLLKILGMSSLLRAPRRCFALALLQPLLLFGPAAFSQEISLLGSRSGDQFAAQAAFSTNGGYVVWQDSLIDGKGFGIAAQKLTTDLAADGAVFRVNVVVPDSQVKPQIALLKNGSYIFVWQSGKNGSEDIIARVRTARGAWATGELFVNTFRKGSQVDPAAAALANGNAVVLWSSADQDGSYWGVYGQRLTPAGAKVGREFRVNQSTNFSQRNASVAALPNGGFVAAWISEQQRGQGTVDVFARIFKPDGTPLGDEFLVNTTLNLCAAPAVSSVPGGFAAVWGERNPRGDDKSSDIFMRTFAADGTGAGEVARVNSTTEGDQMSPKIVSGHDSYEVVWSGPGGIYGQKFSATGARAGDEIQINGTKRSQQVQPAATTTSAGGILVLWSGYVFGGSTMDVFARQLR